ncbi:unnamed protein product [Menidia menidia]|uniref:(Atlantic silverside) hypothetical protein n=1 Tax=Menidia menidia TaxID=238744 RepID=A0A8S4AY73_9TELE|nr:unnamed protein product [Menidia menidia]
MGIISGSFSSSQKTAVAAINRHHMRAGHKPVQLPRKVEGFSCHPVEASQQKTSWRLSRYSAFASTEAFSPETRSHLIYPQ